MELENRQIIDRKFDIRPCFNDLDLVRRVAVLYGRQRIRTLRDKMETAALAQVACLETAFRRIALYQNMR